MSEPASLDLGLRLRRAGSALAFLGLSLPLGLAGALVLLGLGVGAALSVIWVGVPLLRAAAVSCRWVAEQDRQAANALLSAHIPALPERWNRLGAPRRKPLDVLADRQLTRVLTLLAVKLPIAVAALALAAGTLVVVIGLLALGVKGVAGLGETTYVGPLRTSPVSGVLLLLLALPVAVLVVAGLGAVGRMLRSLTRALLIAPAAVAGGPVREMLAESLGDRTLSIAYWLPDRGIFVDDAGRTVSLPDAGSGRAWTAVERDGRRVAAILHDAELDAGPELVNAAAAAAALALDNERLKADLRARVEELRVSRVRIVEAADAARRRIERDLHDGAQQQLVSLALDLRVLKARVGESEAAALVDELAAKLGLALAELRELARGIHPAVLTAQGLKAAIDSLAQRAAVPVECHVDIGEERLSPPIEAGAYFLVSEALTNVARYARAGQARVDVRRLSDEVVVVVEDDGVGGADVGAGSGLRGLADRIAALDGTLTVVSPRGRGTRVEARIPCGAGAIVAEAHHADAPAPVDAPAPSLLEAPR